MTSFKMTAGDFIELSCHWSDMMWQLMLRQVLFLFSRIYLKLIHLFLRYVG